MAGNAPGNSTDEHRFADRGANIRRDRNARKRDIEHLAIYDIAVSAREADIALCWGAIVPAQCRFIDGAATHIELEQFGEAFALVCGAIELDTKAVLFRASDAAFKPAKAIDVNDDERAGRRNDVAKDTCPTWRQIHDLAGGLAVFARLKLAAGEIDSLALIASTLCQ